MNILKQMMMNKVLLSFFILLTISCKKEKDPEPTPTPTPIPIVKDCETNNYGIITANFSSNLVAHSILLTYPDFTFREKIIPIGTFSDTIRIYTGNYVLSLSSLNTLGLAIKDSITNSSISTCQEKSIEINF